jgi:hypothetical protein
MGFGNRPGKGGLTARAAASFWWWVKGDEGFGHIRGGQERSGCELILA